MIFKIRIVSMITPIIIMKIFKSKHVLVGCMVYICFISKKIISWFFLTPKKESGLVVFRSGLTVFMYGWSYRQPCQGSSNKPTKGDI